MAKTHDSPKLLTIRESAAVAGVHRATVAKWVARGDLRAAQREPQILIDREDLDQFLRNRNQATDAEDASLAPPSTLDEILMADTHASPKGLTMREAAAVAGVHRATVAKWIAKGDLRAAHHEPQTLIDPDELDQFLRNRKKPANVRDASQTSNLTLDEAAEIASVHRTTVGNWIASGKLHAVQRKPWTLVGREDLDQFLRRQREQAESGNQSPTAKSPFVSRSPQNTVVGPAANPLVFGRKDAAILLGVHPDTITRWRREERLHATPDGDIALAEIERIVAASLPASGPQLELLRERASPASEEAGGQSPAWLLLARLLEAEHQHAAKLQQQLDVTTDLLNRTLALLETRSKRPSGDSKPTEVPLTNRVLTFLQSYPGPHSSSEIREALDLPENPRDALNKLVDRDLIKRLSPGVFESLPKSVPPIEPAEGTLMAKVLAYVREMTGEGSSRRGVASWQVQQALDLPQLPDRTLSRLRERGLIHRIRAGVYSSRPLKVDEKREAVEEETEEEDR